MAADEMHVLSTDKWDAEIWGAPATHASRHPHPRPILRFLFGKQDHWIANETRDNLISSRGCRGESEDGHEAWKPIMEVDEEEGWEHSFCVRDGQSRGVAERVRGYVGDIVEADMGMDEL